MEMPHKSFTTKLLAARTPGVSVAAIRRKVLNTDQWRDLTASVKSVKDLELWFTVSLEQTLVSVLSAATDRARILDRAGKKLTLVVIDHIGLVKPSAELLKKGTREQQVAETSRGLRVIATKLGCHVMALAQIHRDAERQKNADAMPKLHHLRESGSLEQDADQIFIMHRPRDPMSGIFIKGKPTAFALAKGRLDETSITLLEFERGRYIDTLKDYDDEYKDGDE
jgi:replicative DNA helicase